MSKVTDIKKAAKEYPGSYRLGVSGRAKIKGIMVSFIAYTNPNNITSYCYIGYVAAGKDGGISSKTLDIYNIDQVKKFIELDL